MSALDQDHKSFNALRSLDLFKSLSDSYLESLARQVRRRSYKAGYGLFTQGDDGDKLFIIVAGSISIQRCTPAGKVVHIAMRGPGEYIGEMSLIDDERRMADAIASTDCEVLILSRDSFLDSLRAYPDISISIMKSLAVRLREAGDRLEARHELDVTGRVAEVVLDMALRDGQRNADGSITLARAITHQELADIIGAARESVSRAISDLNEVGYISAKPRRPMVVLDEVKLKRRCAR